MLARTPTLEVVELPFSRLQAVTARYNVTVRDTHTHTHTHTHTFWPAHTLAHTSWLAHRPPVQYGLCKALGLEESVPRSDARLFT